MSELRPKTVLFCAVLAFAIALSMLLRGRRTVHWLFAAFSAEIAFWYASQSFVGLFQAPIWVRATAVLTVFLPQFAVHLFQAIVPLEAGAPASKLPRVAALLGVPMLALELSPYHEAPLSLGAAYFYVFGLISAALISLAVRGRRSKSRAVRDRVRFLVVVGAAATTFTLADFLSFLGVVLPPIGAVLAIVFLFVLAESLTRPRLADLYEMAGRSLVSTALAFSFAGIFYVFVTYVGRFNTMYLNGVLAAIVFLVLFEPLQAEVERRIHQFFFRERFDLETSVTDLRRRLSHVLERQEMVDVLLGGLDRSRRVTAAAIYLRDQEGNGFDLAGSIGPVSTGEAETDSPLFARIPMRLETLAARPMLDRLTQQSSISLEELSREGKDTDAPVLTAASALGAMQSAVLLGVKGDDDELVGIICVADDRVRDAFTPEEVKVLENVAAQIGVAIANSRIYSRMKERDRLAALGAMAAGLAHEVKNPLGAIKGAAQLLDEMNGAEAAQEWVGIILEEVNRLDRVVGSFLDYARPHAGNPVPLDLNGAVRRTVQIWSSQQLHGVDISLELADELPRAKIDPEQFRQVLLNLVQNAVQAMDGQGRVFVSTQRQRSARQRSWSQTGGGDKGPPSVEPAFVEVSVRDTGPGISQKVLKNLFIPFFTTKDQGTGLGLAISQSIVQNVGGTIEVQTQPGAGTTFTITLPAALEPLATPLPAAAEPKPDAATVDSSPVPAKA